MTTTDTTIERFRAQAQTSSRVVHTPPPADLLPAGQVADAATRLRVVSAQLRDATVAHRSTLADIDTARRADVAAMSRTIREGGDTSKVQPTHEAAARAAAEQAERVLAGAREALAAEEQAFCDALNLRAAELLDHLDRLDQAATRDAVTALRALSEALDRQFRVQTARQWATSGGRHVRFDVKQDRHTVTALQCITDIVEQNDGSNR